MDSAKDPKMTQDGQKDGRPDGRPDGFKIVTRGHWGCKVSSLPNYFAYKRTPSYIYYMNTFTSKCEEERQCKVSLMEMMDKTQDFKYLPRYNFVIGGDGNVYEVRGWKYCPVLPRGYKYNQGSGLLLGLLGNYNEVTMPDKMFDLAIKFIQYGQHMSHITRNIEIYNILDKTIFHSPPYHELKESDFGYY